MEALLEVTEVQAEGQVETGAEGEEKAEDACMACGEASGGRVMLLCDGCNAACHLKCTQPRLRRTPAGDWYCTDWCARALPQGELPVHRLALSARASAHNP